MSEDEDEELAMLRLQALMSKRRGGAGTSKSLPMPVPVTPMAAEPIMPVVTEVRETTPPVVVTSAPAAVPDPVQGITNNAGSYRHPRFGHRQASYCDKWNSGGNFLVINMFPVCNVSY